MTTINANDFPDRFKTINPATIEYHMTTSLSAQNPLCTIVCLAIWASLLSLVLIKGSSEKPDEWQVIDTQSGKEKNSMTWWLPLLEAVAHNALSKIKEGWHGPPIPWHRIPAGANKNRILEEIL